MFSCIKRFLMKKSVKHEIHSMLDRLKGQINDDKRALMEAKLKSIAARLEEKGVDTMDHLEEVWKELRESWDGDWEKVKQQMDILLKDLEVTAQKKTSHAVIKGLKAINQKLKEIDSKIKNS
jgi:hypothetical protein